MREVPWGGSTVAVPWQYRSGAVGLLAWRYHEGGTVGVGIVAVPRQYHEDGIPWGSVRYRGRSTVAVPWRYRGSGIMEPVPWQILGAVLWRYREGGIVAVSWRYREGGTVGVGAVAVPWGTGQCRGSAWESITLGPPWGDGGAVAVPQGRYRGGTVAVP